MSYSRQFRFILRVLRRVITKCSLSHACSKTKMKRKDIARLKDIPMLWLKEVNIYHLFGVLIFHIVILFVLLLERDSSSSSKDTGSTGVASSDRYIFEKARNKKSLFRSCLEKNAFANCNSTNSYAIRNKHGHVIIKRFVNLK